MPPLSEFPAPQGSSASELTDTVILGVPSTVSVSYASAEMYRVGPIEPQNGFSHSTVNSR